MQIQECLLKYMGEGRSSRFIQKQGTLHRKVALLPHNLHPNCIPIISFHYLDDLKVDFSWLHATY